MARPERRAWQVSPSPAALAWASTAVGPGARVRAVRRLGAGIAQATHALTIDDAAGRRHRLVLQRWLRPGWEADDPGFDPAKEAAVLDALAGGPVAIPRIVAVDPSGAASGAPALLTERLPGRPPTDRLVRRPAVLDALGSTLAAIHRLGDERATPAVRAVIPAYYPFGELADAVVPAASGRADLWQTALRIAAEPPPPGRPATLLHRDYHAGNTLWLDGRLTGVVDWSSASWGPPAADLAHLRVELATAVSVEAAVRVRSAYAVAGGDLTDARHHTLRTVFDYLSDADPSRLGSTAVQRLDAFVGVVLEERDP
ncbi:MAG TPA: phosphotransferase [Candidatus Limnocylindrales bacterium]|nr:phosphotransferase [Candidatus Limnocylindrales bacterium]